MGESRGKIKVTSSPGDPYKYSDYLEADHSDIQHQAPNIPFNDILGDGYFDDSDGGDNRSSGSGSNQGQDFDFDDCLPFLEEEEEEDDPTFCHPAADRGEQDKGEILSPLSSRQQPRQIDLPPFFGFETPPHQGRGCLSTPIQRLPQHLAEEEAADRAIGGERER
jgi:hypothetical protein